MKISRKKIKKPDPPSPDKEGKKEVTTKYSDEIQANFLWL